MNIDYRLLTSILALLVSLAAFSLSLWNFRFNRNVKSVELRANLLMKYAEINNQIRVSKEFVSLLKIEAEQKGDLELYKIASAEKFYEDAAKKMETHTEMVKSMKSSLGVTLYERLFHDLFEMQKFLEFHQSSIEKQIKFHKEKSL